MEIFGFHIGARTHPPGAPATTAAPARPPAASAQPLILTDLRVGARDETDYTILDIYARKLPDYVVYRTKQRVAVQFADLRSDAAKQRKMMATLNPLRGEINGLIDGWRLKKEKSGPKRRAERFDRRVADALVAALEGDVANAAALLKAIRQDIVDERTAWARFLYLIVALGVGLLGKLTAFLMVRLGDFPPVAVDIYHGAGAGLVGAFFSIALAIRGRTVLPDLQWIANAMDAGLRMLVGLIGAGLLVAMVDAHMVNVSFGLPDATGNMAPPAAKTAAGNAPAVAPTAGTAAPAGGGGDRDQAWLRVLIFGFVAGFSERFVPDLLAKATVSAADPAAKAPAAAASDPADGPPDKKPDDAPIAAPAARKFGDSVQDTAPDDEAHDDNCTCDTPLTDAEATADAHLPAASGGVAIPAAAEGAP
jgi:hypothetical protein